MLHGGALVGVLRELQVSASSVISSLPAGRLLWVAACPANANLFPERSVAFAEIDFNA
jgi:hypothetical protein